MAGTRRAERLVLARRRCEDGVSNRTSRLERPDNHTSSRRLLPSRPHASPFARSGAQTLSVTCLVLPALDLALRSLAAALLLLYHLLSPPSVARLSPSSRPRHDVDSPSTSSRPNSRARRLGPLSVGLSNKPQEAVLRAVLALVLSVPPSLCSALPLSLSLSLSLHLRVVTSPSYLSYSSLSLSPSSWTSRPLVPSLSSSPSLVRLSFSLSVWNQTLFVLTRTLERTEH